MKQLHILVYSLLIVFGCACNKDSSNLPFPEDCTSDLSNILNLSEDWPSDWIVYGPNMFLIDPNAGQAGTL